MAAAKPAAPAPPPAAAAGVIRSYALRGGRATPAQKRALQQWGGRYLAPTSAAPANWAALFGNAAPLRAEVGCGYGESFAAAAAAAPQANHIGFEVCPAAVGATLNRLAAAELTNARVVFADALLWLPQMFAAGALAEVGVFFPDPWHKKRHNKRRLLRPAFVAALARALAVGGVARWATDNADYAAQIQQTFASCPAFAPLPPPLPPRPPTKYERAARADGRVVWEQACRRLPAGGGKNAA